MNKGKFITAILVLAGCVSSCSDRPSNVLSEKEMVSLLADMELAESYSQQQSSQKRNDRLELGKRVLLTHGVSEETLDTTLAWYGRNMDEYTELFEKVDKEINRRKEKYTVNSLNIIKNQSDIWPYSPHIIVSNLNPDDFLKFSIDDPKMGKGEIVVLSLATGSPVTGKGILGVEYLDGSGESFLFNYVNRNHLDLDLQSDTSKTVSRLYGVLSFNDRSKYPLYIDSISIVTQPVDTLKYRQKRRVQKQYGIMLNKKEEIKPDTIVVSDSIKITPPLIEEEEESGSTEAP